MRWGAAIVLATALLPCQLSGPGADGMGSKTLFKLVAGLASE